MVITLYSKAISKYDNVNVNLKKIKVSDQEIQSAISSVDKSFVKAVNYARKIYGQKNFLRQV